MEGQLVAALLMYFTAIICAERFSAPMGVSLMKEALYNPLTNFTCFDGSRTFPFAYVNDDYCDCVDGSDEPGTSACPNSVFHCRNVGFHSVDIPSSRVKDGICDCCDASDEYFSRDCERNCDILGSEAKAQAEREAQLLAKGNELRIQFIIFGRRLKVQKQEKITTLAKELQEALARKEEVEQLKNAAEDAEREAIEKFKIEHESVTTNEEAAATAEEPSAEKQEQDSGSPQPQAETFPEPEPEPVTENPKETVNIGTVEEVNLFHPQKVEEKIQDEDEAKAPNAFAEEDEDHKDEGEEEEDHDDEDEDESDSSASKADEAVPEYDDETKRIVSEATELRSRYDAAHQSVQDLEREINKVKDSLAKDYGPDEEFASLEGQCFNYSDREYTYKLCPFDQAVQIGKSGGHETRLGSWKSWVGEGEYHTMLYDRGQSCWNGPHRSTQVRVSCGLENVLTGASEPNKCEYVFDFETPAACRVDDKTNTASEKPHDEL